MPNWLPLSPHPLFVSQRRLAGRSSFPRAKTWWGKDSGGFSELFLFGEWRTTPRVYARDTIVHMHEIGKMRWAAIQDYMCEPFILKKTGLTIAEHQRRTVASYLTLRDLAPQVPWAPVLQGYSQIDYLRHVDAYDRAGVKLSAAPVVGVGSVCRRQHTEEIAQLIKRLSGFGLRLHGFGVKMKGLERIGMYLHSADSMAWSFDARRSVPLPGCTHANCANCYRYAMRWRDRVINALS